MKPKYVAIFSALLASICCIGPLLLVAIGMGAGAVFIGRYHWFFVIGGLAVLTWAWTKYLRERAICKCEHTPMEGRRSGLFALLIATAMVLGFVGLNISRFVFASTPPLTQRQSPMANGVSRVLIQVRGLSCVTCEI